MAGPVFLAVPSWVWATLLMVAFVGVTAATMWLVRYPIRRRPPDDGLAAPEQPDK